MCQQVRALYTGRSGSGCSGAARAGKPAGNDRGHAAAAASRQPTISRSFALEGGLYLPWPCAFKMAGISQQAAGVPLTGERSWLMKCKCKSKAVCLMEFGAAEVEQPSVLGECVLFVQI